MTGFIAWACAGPIAKAVVVHGSSSVSPKCDAQGNAAYSAFALNLSSCQGNCVIQESTGIRIESTGIAVKYGNGKILKKIA